MRQPSIAGLGLVALLTLGCAGADHDHPPAAPPEPEKWAVTAWGDRFEIFAECDPLVVREKAVCATHVTLLGDFSPLRAGAVAAVLQGTPVGTEVFTQPQLLRDGIYLVEILPTEEGPFDLLFRVDTQGTSEEIAAGRVHVGSSAVPGSLTEAPRYAQEEIGVGQPIAFLKEQQWRTRFATAWVREGTVHEVVIGPGRVRPPSGGEVLLTAPTDGIVLGEVWPHVGQAVGQGEETFRVVPRVGSDKSLAELESTVSTAETELEATRRRLERLEELLRLEAVSLTEVDGVRARAAVLEAQRVAARQDLSTARSARHGTGGGERVAVRAPFTGRIAEVRVTPGQAVSAGEPLGRVVKTGPLWIDIALPPGGAEAVMRHPAGLYLRRPDADTILAFEPGEVRFISRSPEIDAQTGRVGVTFAIPASTDSLEIGAAVEAEILLPDERQGIVVPASAVVDDGGVPIVYLQVGGETFIRQEIRITARQGPSLLVEGLVPMSRLVTEGGGIIRRATLLSSGPIEGHVH